MNKLLLCILLLSGCSIRAVAILETGDAIDGKTTYSKDAEHEKQANPIASGIVSALLNPLFGADSSSQPVQP